jgi:hypothetical protein
LLLPAAPINVDRTGHQNGDRHMITNLLGVANAGQPPPIWTIVVPQSQQIIEINGFASDHVEFDLITTQPNTLFQVQRFLLDPAADQPWEMVFLVFPQELRTDGNGVAQFVRSRDDLLQAILNLGADPFSSATMDFQVWANPTVEYKIQLVRAP